MEKVDPFLLGWILGNELPDPDRQEIQRKEILDPAAATKALNWLVDSETTPLFWRAADDDKKGFVELFDKAKKRAIALEHVVQQLRGKWARANFATHGTDIEIRGHHYSSAHLCLYCYSRAVRFSVRAAADLKKLLKPFRGEPTTFDSADIKARWSDVRKVLADERWPDVGQLAAMIEAERDWLLIKSDNSPTDDGVPVFLGGGRYQVGNQVICLDGAQANVLQALVEMRAATLGKLKDKSGETNPAYILTTIRKRQPLLTPHIRLPEGKGRGGYSTTIVAAAVKTAKL